MDRLLISSNKSLENDLLRICRLCGMDNPNKIPILDELLQFMNKEDPSDPGIRTKILVCVGIAICRDDGMPHNICTLCSDKISDFYEFREMCMETEKQLKHLLGLLKTESTDSKKNSRKRGKNFSTLAASISLALNTTKKDDVNKMDEDDNIESILGDFGDNVALKNGTKQIGGKRGGNANENASISSAATGKRRGAPKKSKKLTETGGGDVAAKVEGDNKPMVIIPSLSSSTMPATKRRRSKGAKNNDLLTQKIPNQRELLTECLNPKSKKRLSKKMKLMAATNEIPATITSSPAAVAVNEIIELDDTDDDDDDNNINVSSITNILPQLKQEILMEAVPLPQYKCAICGLYFTTQSNYLEHLTFYHIPWTSRYGCSSCCELFKSEAELNDHEYWHKARSHKYTCVVCEKSFERFGAFNKHVSNCREHKMEPFVDDIFCATCNQHFKTVNLYHFHPCAVKQARTFCVACQRAFSGNHPYSRHLRRCIYRYPLPAPPPPPPPEPSSSSVPSDELIESADLDIKNVLTDGEPTEISVDTTDIVNSILNRNDIVKIEPSIEIDNNDVAVDVPTNVNTTTSEEFNNNEEQALINSTSIKEEPIDKALENTIIKTEKDPDVIQADNRKEKKTKRKRKKQRLSDKNKNNTQVMPLIVNVKQEPTDANPNASIASSSSERSPTQDVQEEDEDEEEEGEPQQDSPSPSTANPPSNEASPPIRIKQEIIHPGYDDYNPNIIIKSEPGLFASTNEQRLGNQDAQPQSTETGSPNKQPPILLKFTKRNGRISSKVVPNVPNDDENGENENEINDENNYDDGGDDHHHFMDSNDSDTEENVENRENQPDSDSLPPLTTSTTTEQLPGDTTLPVITEILSGDGQSTKVNNNNNNSKNQAVSGSSRNGKKKNRPKLLQNPFAIAAAKRIKTERLSPERESSYTTPYNENIHDLYVTTDEMTQNYDNLNFNAMVHHHQSDIIIKPDPDALEQQQQIVTINGQSQIIKTEKISDEYSMYANHNDDVDDDETSQSIENPHINVFNNEEYNTMEQSINDTTSLVNNSELNQSKSPSPPPSSSVSSLSTENTPVETVSTMKSLEISIPQEAEEEERKSSSSHIVNDDNKIKDTDNSLSKNNTIQSSEKNISVDKPTTIDDSLSKTNQNDIIQEQPSLINQQNTNTESNTLTESESPSKVMTIEKEKEPTVEKEQEDSSSSSSSSEDEDDEEEEGGKKVKGDKKLKTKKSNANSNDSKHSTIEVSSSPPTVMVVSQSNTQINPNQSLPTTGPNSPSLLKPDTVASNHSSPPNVQQKSPHETSPEQSPSSSSNIQQPNSPSAAISTSQTQQLPPPPPSPQKTSPHPIRIPSPIQSASSGMSQHSQYPSSNPFHNNTRLMSPAAQYPSISSSVGLTPQQQQQQQPKPHSPYVASPKPSPELMSPPDSPLNQMLLNQTTPKRRTSLNNTAFASTGTSPKSASYIMLSPSRPQRQDSPYTSSPQRSPYAMSPSQNIQSPSNTMMQLSPSQYGTSPQQPQQQQQRSSCYYDQRSPISNTNLLQIQSTLNNSDYPSSSSSSQSQQQQQQPPQRSSCQYANQQSPQQHLMPPHYQSPNSKSQNLFTKSTPPPSSSSTSSSSSQQHSPYGNNLYSSSSSQDPPSSSSSSILSGNLQQPSSCMMMNENRSSSSTASSHMNHPGIDGGFTNTNVDQSSYSTTNSFNILSQSSQSQCANNSTAGYHHHNSSPNHTITSSHLNNPQSSCLISPNHQQQQHQQSPHHHHHHQNVSMMSQQQSHSLSSSSSSSSTNSIVDQIPQNNPLTISTNSIFNQNFIDFNTNNFQNNHQFNNDFNNQQPPSSSSSSSSLLSTVSNNTLSATSTSTPLPPPTPPINKIHQKLEDELEDIIKSITTSTAAANVTPAPQPPPISTTPSTSIASTSSTSSSSSTTTTTTTTTNLYESIEKEFQTDRLLSELTAGATAGQEDDSSYLFDDVDATDVDLDLDSALLDDDDDDDDDVGGNDNINNNNNTNTNTNLNNNINNNENI